MWGSTDHEATVQYGVTGTQMSFTSEQMKILTFACNYPDKKDSGLEDMDANPYHGFFQQRKSENGNKLSNPLESNYIANYIFLTKVAILNGNAAGVNYNVIYQGDRIRIVNDISTTNLGTRTWKQVFDIMNADKETNIPVNQENIRLFIYGIAIHCITDITAHSTWANQDFDSEGWSRVRHKSNYEHNADNPNYLPLRYTTAQTLARSALIKAYNSSEGMLIDFLLPSSYFGDFYLKNFSKYAEMVDSVIYNNAKSNFDRADLDSNIANYNTEY